MTFQSNAPASTFLLGFLLLSCGGAPSEPQQQADLESAMEEPSPFPPPPIDIDKDNNNTIQWKVNNVVINLFESSNRLTDELAWKVQLFTVIDLNGVSHPNVLWVTIVDQNGATRANIAKVGGRFEWLVDGTAPALCSRHDVTPDVPACQHNGVTAGNSGIPASLAGIQSVKFMAKWRNPDSSETEAEVMKILIRGRTCPPYA